MPAPQHFDLPFRVHGGSAATVEQDSDRDVENAVYGQLATEQGTLEWLPAFGRPDWAFLPGGLDPEEDRALVAQWEPRADLSITAGDLVRGAINRLSIDLGGSAHG